MAYECGHERRYHHQNERCNRCSCLRYKEESVSEDTTNPSNASLPNYFTEPSSTPSYDPPSDPAPSTPDPAPDFGGFSGGDSGGGGASGDF